MLSGKICIHKYYLKKGFMSLDILIQWYQGPVSQQKLKSKKMLSLENK